MEEERIPKAISSATSTIFGVELHCRVLDDGRRIIDAEDIERLLCKLESVAVRAWIAERIRLCKNEWPDSQITEALAWIDTVMDERALQRIRLVQRIRFTRNAFDPFSPNALQSLDEQQQTKQDIPLVHQQANEEEFIRQSAKTLQLPQD